MVLREVVCVFKNCLKNCRDDTIESLLGWWVNIKELSIGDAPVDLGLWKKTLKEMIESIEIMSNWDGNRTEMDITILDSSVRDLFDGDSMAIRSQQPTPESMADGVS